jgi:hypothetical protein
MPIASSTTVGEVVMAYDADPRDAQTSTTTFADVVAQWGSVAGNVWTQKRIDVPKMYLQRYAAYFNEDAGTDRTSNLGVFHIRTSEGANAAPGIYCGKSFIEYDISLMIPERKFTVATYGTIPMTTAATAADYLFDTAQLKGLTFSINDALVQWYTTGGRYYLQFPTAGTYIVDFVFGHQYNGSASGFGGTNTWTTDSANTVVTALEGNYTASGVLAGHVTVTVHSPGGYFASDLTTSQSTGGDTTGLSAIVKVRRSDTPEYN